MKQVNASLSDMLHFQLFMWKGRERGKQQLANRFPRVFSPSTRRHMMARVNFCLCLLKALIVLARLTAPDLSSRDAFTG